MTDPVRLPAATRKIMRYAFLVSTLITGFVTALVLIHVFDIQVVTASLIGLVLALGEWGLLSFVFRKIGGGRLSDFDDPH